MKEKREREKKMRAKSINDNNQHHRIDRSIDR